MRATRRGRSVAAFNRPYLGLHSRDSQKKKYVSINFRHSKRPSVVSHPATLARQIVRATSAPQIILPSAPFILYVRATRDFFCRLAAAFDKWRELRRGSWEIQLDLLLFSARNFDPRSSTLFLRSGLPGCLLKGG